jgi:hypothetical protein
VALVKVLVRKSFHRSKLAFVASIIFGKVRFLKLASRFSVSVLAGLVQAFLSGSFFLAKALVCKIIFLASVLAGLALAFSMSAASVSAKSALPKFL